MKRRFTILTAALALLVTLAIPMGMRGQSDYSSDYTGNITLSTTGGSNASDCEIIISETGYNGIKAGTSSKVGAVVITVPSGTKYLHIHAAAWSNTTCSLTVTPEGYSSAIALTANSGISNNSPFTFEGDASTSDYYKVITFSSALTSDTDFTFTATGGKRFVIWGVTSEEEGSPALVATPTFNPASGAEFGNDGLQVTISCETTGARIYYTLDGSTPDDGSNYYQSAINLTETTTIKAIAYDNDDNTSSVATAIYTYVDPNAPGTENNPYTVAQARAAIDAGTGTQGVYATGIVSAIPTAYNSSFGNVTFNMVDEAGDEVFLQAYRCGGDEAANVAVGDVVVVYGNLTYHAASGTYEFGQGCEVVSLTHPVITTPVVTVTPNTINAPAEGADGTLALTYENIEEFISFDYYFCDANGNELEDTDPDYPGDWIYAEINEPGEEENYTLSYIIDANDGEARTAYVKVYTFDDNLEEVYAIVTINQDAYVAPALDYAELPFEFDGGRADIENTDGLTQEGLDTDYSSSPKLKFNTTGDWLLLHFNEQPGTLTFDIKGNGFSGGTFTVQTSEDGETYTDLATYTSFGSSVESEEFTNLGENVRYIKWIYTEKVSGNVGLGNIALAEYTEPQQYTLTVEPFENLELITFVNEEMIMEGDGEITVTEGDEIMLSIVALEGYEMETLMVNGENHVNDIADDYTYTFVMPAENVTISATAVEDVPVTPGTWVLTNLTDLTENDVFVIVGTDADDDTFALPYNGGTSAAPSATAITIVENAISGEPAAELQWNLSGNTTDGYTFYPNGEIETWLYCTNTNNGVRVGTNVNKTFKMDEDGYLVNDATSRVLSIYVNNGTPQDWRCYSNYNNNPVVISFYKKVAEPVTETYTLDITGYEAGSDGGYYLIASPVTVDLTNHDMTTGDFDLYYFDNAQDDEWRNYRQEAFNLKPGKGYLYAKKATDDNLTYSFELTGVPYNGNGDVELTYTENADFAGYNLIGNPLNTNATLNMPYYRLNSDGSALNTSTESGQIDVMEGVFVQATAENTTAHFTTAAGSKMISQLNVKVTRNRGAVLDNAIIRFDNGAMLGKFQLNPNSTKVYITEGNEDYAIVRSAAESEMPVSFKAAENGTYTLSVVAENVEMNYLHLIDNMTGTDVDLLATPSYSFEANTTDYANRFRLVFNANGLEENSNFAFFNGSEWVVSNMGDATLQVIDMTGRVISSETVNGNVTFSTNGLTAGVYMMRLVNGNDVKTQKVLVK